MDGTEEGNGLLCQNNKKTATRSEYNTGIYYDI